MTCTHPTHIRLHTHTHSHACTHMHTGTPQCEPGGGVRLLCPGDHLSPLRGVQWNHHGIWGDGSRQDVHYVWSDRELPTEGYHTPGHFTGVCVCAFEGGGMYAYRAHVFGILILCRYSKRFVRGQRPQSQCGKHPVSSNYSLTSIPDLPFPLTHQQYLLP